MKLLESLETSILFMKADVPVHWVSKPGEGKTTIISNTLIPKIREYLPDFYFLPIYLYNYDGPELHGLQFPDQKTKKTRVYPPDIWPSKDQCGLIFFDELLAADRMLQVSAYQIMHEKRIGEIQFPNVRRMAASNAASHKAIINQMATPLANRMAHIEIMSDTDGFVSWGTNTQDNLYPEFDADVQELCKIFVNPPKPPEYPIHMDIISYLKFKPEHGNTFDPTRDERAFATPRSWENVSKILYLEPRPNLIYKAVSAIIGEMVATSFVGFLKVKNDIDDAVTILANPKTARIPQTPAGLFAVCNMLAYYADHENFDAIVTYSDRLSSQFSTMLIKDCKSRHPEIVHTAAFGRWALHNASSLI